MGFRVVLAMRFRGATMSLRGIFVLFGGLVVHFL